MSEKKGPGGSGGSGRIAVDVRKFSHSMTTVFYGLAELFSSMGAVEEGETLAESDLAGDAQRSVAKEREVQERRERVRRADAVKKSKKGVDDDADGKDEGKNPATGVPGRPGGDGTGDDGGTAGNDGAVGAEESGNGRQGSEVPMDRTGESAAAGLDADHGGGPGGGAVPASDPSEVNSMAPTSTDSDVTAGEDADEAVDNHSDDGDSTASLDNGSSGEDDAGGAGETSITPDDITKVIVAKIKADRKNSAKIKKMLKEKYRADKVSQLKPEHYEAFLTDISGV